MEKKSPAVSVLMPAYNAEKYIGEAIESILNQTFTDFEFIIIDDCSTDGTWDIIQEYAKRDSRISISRNEENLQISRTRNKLVEKAKGDYIVWQDADDISLPYRIKEQYEFMEAHPEVGICGGYLEFFDVRGICGIRKYKTDDSTLRKKIFRYSPVAQPSAIVRISSLSSKQPYPDSNVAEDLAVSFQIGKTHKFANLPKVVLRYRMNEKGTTYKNLQTMELYTLYLRAKYSSNDNYQMSFADRFYNILQCGMVFLIPPSIKMKLFNAIRNTK